MTFKKTSKLKKTVLSRTLPFSSLNCRSIFHMAKYQLSRSCPLFCRSEVLSRQHHSSVPPFFSYFPRWQSVTLSLLCRTSFLCTSCAHAQCEGIIERVRIEKCSYLGGHKKETAKGKGEVCSAPSLFPSGGGGGIQQLFHGLSSMMSEE